MSFRREILDHGMALKLHGLFAPLRLLEQPNVVGALPIQRKIDPPERPIDRQIFTSWTVGDKAKLEATIAKQAYDLLIPIAANTVWPAGELSEGLLDFEPIAQIIDHRIAKRRYRSSESDLVAITTRPARVPGFDLAQFGAGEDAAPIESSIPEIDPVVGGHFPAYAPAILFVADVGEGVALLQRLGQASVGSRTREKCSGNLLALHVDEDMEDLPCALRIMKCEINTPLDAACAIRHPTRHRDHDRVDCANRFAQGCAHLRVGRGNSERLRQYLSRSGGTIGRKRLKVQ